MPSDPNILKIQDLNRRTVTLEEWGEGHPGLRYLVRWEGKRGLKEENKHWTDHLEEAEVLYEEWCRLRVEKTVGCALRRGWLPGPPAFGTAGTSAQKASYRPPSNTANRT